MAGYVSRACTNTTRDRPAAGADRQMIRGGRRTCAVPLGVAVHALVLAACQSGSPSASRTPTVSPDGSTGADDIVLVALGDSVSTGHGDPTGTGWVGYYGKLIQTGTGRVVDVHNLAQDGTTTTALLATIRSDDEVRAAIADADVVAIGMGGNELEMGDAAMEAGSCAGTACYDEPARLYRTNLDAIASEIESLTAGKPTVLRAVGMLNALTGAESVIPPFLKSIATQVGSYQAKLFDTATCDVMDAHGGACAPLRKAFNGAHGTEDAYATGLLNLDDCCYPTEAGHRLIAKILYETGSDPLSSATP